MSQHMLHYDLAGLVFTDLSTSDGWDYGGHAYGLEPLTLPFVGQPDQRLRTVGRRDGTNYQEALGHLRQLNEGGQAVVEPSDSADELFWFRWITGHQVCFAVWRLMAQAREEAERGRRSSWSGWGSLSHYVRAYSAMLLYTGSCPREVYHRVIRPSMRLRHPSFSGAWAPDFWPVRDLLRSRQVPAGWGSEQAALHEAIQLHHLVHDGVAARLVPDGRSLLRQSAAMAQDVRLLNLIYDNYFVTLRGPVTRHDVVAQLLRRLVAVAQDIVANGLYPKGMSDLDDLPEELTDPAVQACERDVLDILWRVAGSAATALFQPSLVAEATGERADVVGRTATRAGIATTRRPRERAS